MRLQLLVLLASLSPFVSSQTSIKQLHIVFRHGERAPTETYKNDPYINHKWSGGWGQLTNTGKLQMYNLGQRFREVYKEFIPQYYFHEDVEILSSYADRCLMSAELFLAGVFPPKGQQIWNQDLPWQPIAVKYFPRNKDYIVAMKAACKKYDEELKTLRGSEEMRKFDEENRELYNYLTDNTGQEMANILEVELLYNTLEIELIHNLTLPKWTKSIDFERMKKIAAKSLAVFTWSDYMKRVKGGVFLNKTTTHMRSNTTVPLLYLYSAHDLTLVNILRSLNVVKELKPGFGASLVFELHNSGEVKILYKDTIEDIPKQYEIPSCPSPCNLGDFMEAVKQYLPKDLERECAII